jgi:hypothetical protein
MSEYQTEASCDKHAPCHCPNSEQEECSHSMAEEMMGFVKCAKHDLLKDKMKKLLEAKIGKRLDEVASVAVDAILAKMEHKIVQKNACEQYEDDLMEAWKK